MTSLRETPVFHRSMWELHAFRRIIRLYTYLEEIKRGLDTTEHFELIGFFLIQSRRVWFSSLRLPRTTWEEKAIAICLSVRYYNNDLETYKAFFSLVVWGRGIKTFYFACRFLSHDPRIIHYLDPRSVSDKVLCYFIMMKHHNSHNTAWIIPI